MWVKKTWLSAAAAVATAGLVAAGCGSGSNDPSTGSTPAAAAGTKSPVTLFQIYEQGSKTQNYSSINGGAEAAVRSINTQGGLGGHPIKLVTCDDNSDPNLAVACARKAAQMSPKPLAVVASSTLYSVNTGPVLEAAGIAWVGGWLNDSYATTSPNAYPIAPSAFQNWQGVIFALKAAGAKKVAIARIDVPVTKGLADEGKKAIKPAGLQFAGEVLIPPTVSDYASYVQSVKKTGADAVMQIFRAQDQVGFMRSAQQQGVKLKYGIQLGNFASKDIQAIPKGAWSSMVGASYWPPSKNPGDGTGARQFVKDMAAVQSTNQKNKLQDSVALNGWIDPWALKFLVDKYPDATNDNASLVKALKSEKQGIKIFDLASWKPGASGPKAYPRLTNSNIYFDKVGANGEWQLASPNPIDVFTKMGDSAGA